jgi:hypothetical protein
MDKALRVALVTDAGKGEQDLSLIHTRHESWNKRPSLLAVNQPGAGTLGR